MSSFLLSEKCFRLIMCSFQYAESRKLRLKVNGYKDYTEPVGINDVPKGPISVAVA